MEFGVGLYAGRCRQAVIGMLVVILNSAGALAGAIAPGDTTVELTSLEALGKALFFDTDLSRNRTQSCATCHDPAHGFADSRGGAVSLGDDGVSRGARNAPTASYAAFSPVFRKGADGHFKGGMFWDGRAATAEKQAVQPLLNPAEMAMPSEASVVVRIREKPSYVKEMTELFGPDVFDSNGTAIAALGAAVAAYERSAEVSPFDSKYDRFLKGEYTMTPQEELGRVLFFSNQFTNCGLCHKLEGGTHERETFTNYRYHNVGTPANTELSQRVDRGLGGRRDIKARGTQGQFKVPSLRNVAVTAPYMHNGVFADLRTVILFYNKYNSSASARQINPETSELWGAPEAGGTLSIKELETGPALDDRRIDALIAFLKTLTDARYEGLLTSQAAD